MGSGASVPEEKYLRHQAVDDTFLTSGSSKEEGVPNVLLRATESLSQIMTSPSMLKKLKAFVRQKWQPQIGADPVLSADGRDVSLSFIDFCCDVGDFRKLPACLFQYFQASHIYQTYIVHGAVKRIPISICISDDITDKLSCRHDDQDPQLFSLALGEAVEFLAAEVLPAYSMLHPCLGASDQKDEMTQLMTAGGAARRNSLFQTPDHPLCNAIMLKLLQDSKYVSSFKSFMMEVGGEKILFAFNNLQDIYEYLTLLNVSPDVGDEMRLLNYLELVHAFYKNYMSTGSVYKLPLAAATVEDFLHLISQTIKVDCEVLRPVEENIHQIIIHFYMDRYLSSFQFRQLERTGRQSMSALAEQLTKPCIESSDNLSEMKRFLRSEFDTVFANFLETRGQLAYLYFFQSANRFKEGNFEFDMDRIVQSSYIIDRYIARNAFTQISIPEFIRLRVLKNRFQAPQDMFIEAADWVLHYLCTYYWIKFQEELTKVPNVVTRKASECDLRLNTPTFCLDHSTDKSLQCNQLRRQDSAPLLLPGRAADATCLVQGNNHAELIAVLLGKHNKLPGSTASKLTLHDVLQDPKCCGIFKESLDREGTSQTLLFLMEVEEYRRIPMADYMSRTARKIYNKFIHPQCIMPIPITRLTRDTITVDIEGSSYTQSMFTPAFSEVCQYLEAHQFARFVASVDLMRVIDILKQEAVMEPEQRKLVRRGSIQLSPIVCSSITTFRDIIGSQACTRFFKEYCCRMYCSENLYFWMDAENYCNVPGNDYRRSIAVRIFRKFISSEAKQQINISSQLVATIFDGLQEAGKLLFKQAQAEVSRMMEGDVIPHFLVSEEHQLMIRFVEGIGSDGTAAEASIPLLKKRISNLQKKTILPKLRM